MGCSASVSPSPGEEPEERVYENEELERLLQDGGDVSDYTILQIALCQMSYPEVVLSSKSKSEIVRSDRGEYKKSKDLAKDIFTLRKYSCADLVKALTEGLVSNLSKAKAIYLFIASLDISQMRKPDGEEITPNSPLDYILHKIKTYKGNHAHLFCALCRIACVPCQVISGYNKSSLYQLGKPIDRKKLSAQWNAVYVEYEWRLVDCFWSTVCVSSSEEDDLWDVLDVNGRLVTDKQVAGNDKITHRINDFYFLTDPLHFISTHIPRNRKWQLLAEKNTITVADFEQAAYTRDRFYELSLRTTEDDLKKCRLRADHGQVAIDLEILEDSPSIDFKYMLFMAKSNSKEDTLEKFVMFERGSGIVRYETNIPIKGTFKLDIFGRDSRKHNSMDLVCSYLIDCGAGSDDKEPLPDDPAIGWGAETGYLSAYGIVPVSHKAGVITTTTGEVDIKFSLSQPLELMCLLLSNSHTKEQLDQFVYLEVSKDECIIHVTLPKCGVYACELFANEEGLPGELQNVCNYVIKCYNKKIKNEPLPYIANGRAGNFTIAKELGVEILEPITPVVITKEPKFQVVVKAGEDLRLLSALHHTQQKTEVYNKQITTSREADIVTFDLELLLSGRHSFSLYAAKSDSNHLHNVFNCLIDNHAASTAKASVSALPECETIHIKGGGTTLPVDNVESGAIFATISKERGYMDETGGNVTVIQEGSVTKVNIRVAEDGTYLATVYEQTGESVVEKKRYRLIHEGSISGTKEEVKTEPKEVEVVEEEEEEEEEESIGEEASDGESEEEIRARELRQKLAAAIASGSEEQLEAAIGEFKSAGDVLDPKKLLERAERELKIIKVRRNLQAKTQAEDIDELEAAILEANAIKHRGKLSKEIAEAKHRLEKLIKMEDLKNAVFKLDQRTVAEIKSFSSPPEPIKIVMKGTLLLLGNSKNEVTDWRSVVALMGKTGKESLKRRVMEFRVKNLTLEVASDTKLLLDPMSLTEVRDASTGAATFYLWSLAMIEEAEQRHKNQAT